MDLVVDVLRPAEQDLRAEPATTSERSRHRVAEARERQRKRLADTHARCNGDMDVAVARAHARLDEDAERELGRAYTVGLLSARGRHRVVRVARTIADLGGRRTVGMDDVLTALSLRQRTTTETLTAQ
jgi:magnesium chelatase family protein